MGPSVVSMFIMVQWERGPVRSKGGRTIELQLNVLVRRNYPEGELVSVHRHEQNAASNVPTYLSNRFPSFILNGFPQEST